MDILLLEDDAATVIYVRDGLTARGHAVDVESQGRAGLLRATERRYEVLVIDRMLPELDGLSVLKGLRAASIHTPALLLTAMGGLADRIEGLKAGADDYLVKPFDLGELDARIEALGRRPPLSATSMVLRCGGLELDRLGRKVTFEDRLVELTASEFGMLEVLMLNAGRRVTKAMLLEIVFDLDAAAPGVIVEPHMSRLRAKLQRLDIPDPIRTHRGMGYSIAT